MGHGLYSVVAAACIGGAPVLSVAELA